MKNLSRSLLAILLLALLYYLLVIPYEYRVKFSANTLPGDLIETIRIWNRSLDDAEILEVDSFSVLTQSVGLKNKLYILKWYFTLENDSVTKVNVHISEPGHSLRNKLLVPITHHPIEEIAGSHVRKFYDVLKTHLEITKVKIVGEVSMDSSFCVCRKMETDQIAKANGMMRDFPLMISFIEEFKLIPQGPPIIKIREWNHNAGKLKFDFCFQIFFQDSLPQINSFFYTKIGGGKALKAEYYGNYITSDRAWYELIHYASKNGYSISDFPIEYFHNNPNLGMNEKNWKAEIYLPVMN